MSPINDVPSPGGWLKTYGVRVAKALAIGTTSLAAVFVVYGTMNGGQAEQYCEGVITTATGAGYNAFSCLNPLPADQTGAIMATGDTGLFIDNTPSPTSKLYVGTATTANGSGLNLFNNITLNGANRFYPTSYSGSAVRANGIILVSPSNSAGNRYIVGRYGTGSGQLATGLKVGAYRFRVFPCSGITGLSCK